MTPVISKKSYKNAPKKLGKARLKRRLVFVLFFAAIIFAIILIIKRLMPGMITLIERGDYEGIQEYIRGFGNIRGAAAGFLLQFFQIISVFFPGGPIQVATGAVFGAVNGILICHSAYVLANMLVFLTARRVRSRLDLIFPSEKKGGINLILSAKNPAFMVFMTCMLPLIPNGIVPYMAAETDISAYDFFTAIFFGCIPSLLILCVMGNLLLAGDIRLAALIASLYLAVLAALFFLRNRLRLLQDFFDGKKS